MKAAKQALKLTAVILILLVVSLTKNIYLINNTRVYLYTTSITLKAFAVNK